MKVPHRRDPRRERIHTDPGLFFATDLLGLPPAGAEPLRACGRSMALLFQRRGWFQLDFTGSLDPAADALWRDVARLENFVSRVTAAADERQRVAEVLRGSGFLLRRIVRELKRHGSPSASSPSEDDLHEV